MLKVIFFQIFVILVPILTLDITRKKLRPYTPDSVNLFIVAFSLAALMISILPYIYSIIKERKSTVWSVFLYINYIIISLSFLVLFEDFMKGNENFSEIFRQLFYLIAGVIFFICTAVSFMVTKQMRNLSENSRSNREMFKDPFT